MNEGGPTLTLNLSRSPIFKGKNVDIKKVMEERSYFSGNYFSS